VKLRREQLNDKAGAAEDLKKLHDLSPADVAVMDELSLLLTELGDFRGMVHVLEDQILRGKDPHARAELARKVARLWEEQLQDPREAADAWRRVLRMKPGDADAQAGLERAKTAMLSQPKAEPVSRTSVPDIEPSEPAQAQAEEPAHAVASDEITLTGEALGDNGGSEPAALETSAASAAEEPPAEEAPAEAAPAEEPAPLEPSDGSTLEPSHEAAEAAPAVESAEAAAAQEEEEILAVDDSELVDDDALVDDSEFTDPPPEPPAAEPEPPPAPEPEPEPPRAEEPSPPRAHKRRR
jgi:hypothetical protein